MAILLSMLFATNAYSDNSEKKLPDWIENFLAKKILLPATATKCIKLHALFPDSVVVEDIDYRGKTKDDFVVVGKVNMKDRYGVMVGWRGFRLTSENITETDKRLTLEIKGEGQKYC